MHMQIPVSARDALTIARIVKVNHAGEYGAIRIYSAQMAVARWRCRDIVPDLDDMLAHERNHCAAFRAAMPERNARPCRVMSLWSVGGWVLGFATALMGRQAIWACTAAVESAVHRHLDDQLYFVSNRDPQLRDLILSIREEESAHLRHAEVRLTPSGATDRFIRPIISVATDAVIWLSTWGDSVRMARDLRAAGAARS
jgi:3-demethoxyubiquinol 3-hydroxylase